MLSFQEVEDAIRKEAGEKSDRELLEEIYVLLKSKSTFSKMEIIEKLRIERQNHYRELKG